jgi:hypothetical protein
MLVSQILYHILGIRRGRFSLPLRTQAIVEANSLENKGYNSAMEESDASTPSSTISDSSDDSLSLVPFAGTTSLYIIHAYD